MRVSVASATSTWPDCALTFACALEIFSRFSARLARMPSPTFCAGRMTQATGTDGTQTVRDSCRPPALSSNKKEG